MMFGRFEPRELLGVGGFGRVYRCLDERTGLEVALKELCRLKPSSLVAFKREFLALSDVSHEGLGSCLTQQSGLEDGVRAFLADEGFVDPDLWLRAWTPTALGLRASRNAVGLLCFEQASDSAACV